MRKRYTLCYAAMNMTLIVVRLWSAKVVIVLQFTPILDIKSLSYITNLQLLMIIEALTQLYDQDPRHVP